MDADISTRGLPLPRPVLGSSAPIIERSPLPMIELEGERHVVSFVNPAFCSLLHKPREELLGHPFTDLVSDSANCIEILDGLCHASDKRSCASLGSFSATASQWLLAKWPLEDQRCEYVIIQVIEAPQFRENVAALNEALLVSGLRQIELREAAEKVNDRLVLEIAERRRIEVELKAAQAELRAHAEALERTVGERTAQLQASLGELESLAYSLAHDLRAPVRAISGFTQLALELAQEEIGQPATELLNRVVKAASRMDSLIQDVLALTSVIRRPMTLGAVDVDTLTRTLLQERPEFAPPLAEIEIQGPLLPVLAHEATLCQCLSNLLSNAVKFVEMQVTPRVRVWTEEHREHEGGSWVRLHVEDHGIGIAPDAQGQVFEMFQRLHRTAQYAGSGVGLAIVRKAVERMGGRAGFRSELNHGSVFWLDLRKA